MGYRIIQAHELPIFAELEEIWADHVMTDAGVQNMA